MHGGTEMKRLLVAFFMMLVVSPVFADIHISSDVVLEIMQKHIPEDNLVSALTEYNAQVKKNNGKGLPVTGLWYVCSAAGWDIEKSSDKTKCENFATELVSSAVTYYSVCEDGKGKSGGKEYCIDDFFTKNCIFCGSDVKGEKVQVGLREGIHLAKLYAKVKNNDLDIRCKNSFTSCGINDDCLQCVSKDGKTFYEFMFDDLESSIDTSIQTGVQKGVCKLYDATATAGGCGGGGTNVSGQVNCWAPTCDTKTSDNCSKVNQALSEFGYSASWVNNKCEIDFSSISDRTQLKTAYGLDNFMFCTNIQINATQTLDDYIKDIIQNNGVTVETFNCEQGKKSYTGGGCSKSTFNITDDVVTCYINGNPVDFVFDDLSESSKKRTNAGMQAMDCIVNGGTFTGKRCIGLNEQACNSLKVANLSNCPGCKSVFWDEKTETCVLPDAKAIQNLDKGIEVGLWVGGTVASAVLTAGASLAVQGSLTVGASVVIVVETIGGGIASNETYKISKIADKFFVESNKCQDASCAESLIKQHLQRLANLQGDFDEAEISAIDSEMARLAELIPEDSDFYKNMLINGITLADNDKGLLGWEPEQIWRAVGVALSMTSLITGLIKSVFPAMKKGLDLTSRVLLVRTQNAVKYLNSTQAKFYSAWIEYAPRNQSLGDFIKMCDGDLEKLAEYSKGWRTLAERQAVYKELKFDDDITLLRKLFGKSLDDVDSSFLPLLVKDIEENPSEYIYLFPEYADDINVWANSKKNLTGLENYTTFEKEVSDFIRQADNDPEFTEWLNAIDAQKDRLEQRLRSGQITQAEYDDWIENSYKKSYDNLRSAYKTKYQKLTAEAFPLTNLDEVTKERVILFNEIVAGDKDLALQARNWSSLSNEERLAFGDKILDKFSDYNMIKKPDLYDYSSNLVDPNIAKKAGGYHDTATNRIFIPVEKYSYEDFISVLAHESGHAVDNMNPSMGALGQQRAGWGAIIYSNKVEEGYYDALTEKSSYAIGDAVKESLK